MIISGFRAVHLGFATLVATATGVCAAAAEPSYFIFEGLLEEADAVFGDRIQAGWVFAGALEVPAESFPAAPIAFEYTIDHAHVLEWEGAQLAGTPPESGWADASWAFLRVPVQHEDAITGQSPLGWVEFWLLAEENPADGFTGFFYLHVWSDDLAGYAEASGALTTFMKGDPEASLGEQVSVLETWILDLQAHNVQLQDERDRLRREAIALRERVAGMEGMIDYLLEERQILREQAEAAKAPSVDRRLDEIRAQLDESLAQAALLEQEGDHLRGEALAMADALAVCEAENLRLREALERISRENSALRLGQQAEGRWSREKEESRPLASPEPPVNAPNPRAEPRSAVESDNFSVQSRIAFRRGSRRR